MLFFYNTAQELLEYHVLASPNYNKLSALSTSSHFDIYMTATKKEIFLSEALPPEAKDASIYLPSKEKRKIEVDISKQ